MDFSMQFSMQVFMLVYMLGFADLAYWCVNPP